MTDFTARKKSEAIVKHDQSAVWDVLADPSMVAAMTPMVSEIRADGDLWHWSLARIPLLGKHYDLHFTEQMTFTPRTRIVFTHAPQADSERAGVEGRYDLADTPAGTPAGTRLAIDLSIAIDLPLPRLSRPVVQTAMYGVLEVMGAGFARSLERHLSQR